MLLDFLSSCIACASETGESLPVSLAAGAKQVVENIFYKPSKAELHDWAYGSHLEGKDRAEAIRQYEVAR